MARGPEMLVRRSRFFLLRIEERREVDLVALFEGNVAVKKRTVVTVLSAVARGKQSEIDVELLGLLCAVPAEWTSIGDIEARQGDVRDALSRLLEIGAIVTDATGGDAGRFSLAEESLRQDAWHPTAAVYLSCTRAMRKKTPPSGETERAFDSIVAGSRRQYARWVAKYGPPPSEFRDRKAQRASVPLPVCETESEFEGLLRLRRSVRRFDTDRPLALQQLATVISKTFGCIGLAALAEQVTVLKKSSPSAGSLHPIEAFLLVRDVESVSPGLYHYSVERNAIDQLRTLNPADAEDLALDFLPGQTFAKQAHAVAILAARYPRNTWKYRENARTPLVVAMDAGHLSQTCYLLCADLGLGCFFSAAIDADAVEKEFGLEAFSEGAIGALGIGPLPSDDGSELGLDWDSLSPKLA